MQVEFSATRLRRRDVGGLDKSRLDKSRPEPRYYS